MLKVCEPFPHLHHPNSIFSTPIFASIPLPFRPRAHVRRPNAQRLQLYESHETPKLYACFEKYSAPGDTPSASVLAPIGSSFDVAFDHFKKFFKLKTGKEWDDRLLKTAMAKDDFAYVRPRDGQPKGILSSDALNQDGLNDVIPSIETITEVGEETTDKILDLPQREEDTSKSVIDLCDKPE